MDLLRLIALDSEDLDVLSAHMQDAVLKIGDIGFDAKRQQFALTANRFVHENGQKDRRPRHQRRRAGLHFNRVLQVRSTGLRVEDKERVLALLAIRFIPDEAAGPPEGTIELLFAEEATIALTVECVEAQLADLGPAWETHARPRHPDAS